MCALSSTSVTGTFFIFPPSECSNYTHGSCNTHELQDDAVFSDLQQSFSSSLDLVKLPSPWIFRSFHKPAGGHYQPRTLPVLAMRQLSTIFHTFLSLSLFSPLSRQVHDGEVEYRDISIEGPKGIIRTSPPGGVTPPPPPTPTPATDVSGHIHTCVSACRRRGGACRVI